MGHKAAKREKKRGKKGRPAQEHAQTPLATASSDASDRDEVDLTELASPVAEPPPFQPATRTKSGYAPRMPETPRVDDETLTDHLVSLQPLYRATDAETERAAELEVEDPSLRLEGSFLASPLTSLPPVPVRSLGARIAKAVGIVFLVTSSSFGVWSAVQLVLRPSAAPEVARAEPVEMRPSAPPDEPAAAPELTAIAPAATAPSPAASVAPIDPPSDELPHARVPRRPVGVAVAADAPGAPARPIAAGPAATASAPGEAEAAAATGLAPTAALPKLPSPSAVRASFGQIRPTMSACAAGRKGMVTFRVVVAGSGRVSSGTVEGRFQNPEERTCMTRAILDLRFPPFQQDVFEIAYPLAL